MHKSQQQEFLQYLDSLGFFTKAQFSSLEQKASLKSDKEFHFALSDFFKKLQPAECYDLVLRIQQIWQFQLQRQTPQQKQQTNQASFHQQQQKDASNSTELQQSNQAKQQQKILNQEFSNNTNENTRLKQDYKDKMQANNQQQSQKYQAVMRMLESLNFSQQERKRVAFETWRNMQTNALSQGIQQQIDASHNSATPRLTYKELKERYATPQLSVGIDKENFTTDIKKCPKQNSPEVQEFKKIINNLGKNQQQFTKISKFYHGSSSYSSKKLQFNKNNSINSTKSLKADINNICSSKENINTTYKPLLTTIPSPSNGKMNSDPNYSSFRYPSPSAQSTTLKTSLHNIQQLMVNQTIDHKEAQNMIKDLKQQIEMENCTFQPSIGPANQVGQSIMKSPKQKQYNKRSRSGSPQQSDIVAAASTSIHDKLYRDGLIQKEQKQIYFDYAKNQQEMQECTFSPKISQLFQQSCNQGSTLKNNKSFNSDQLQEDNCTIFERLANRRKKSLQELIKRKKQEEDKECTFQPNTKNSLNAINIVNKQKKLQKNRFPKSNSVSNNNASSIICQHEASQTNLQESQQLLQYEISPQSQKCQNGKFFTEKKKNNIVNNNNQEPQTTVSKNQQQIQNQIFNKLYHEQQIKNQIQMQNEIIKAQSDLEHCTFQPNISTHRSPRSGDRETSTDRNQLKSINNNSYQVFDKLYKENENKLKKLIAQKMEAEYQELRQCTFSPQICDESKKLARTKSTGSTSRRLYEEAREREQKLETERYKRDNEIVQQAQGRVIRSNIVDNQFNSSYGSPVVGGSINPYPNSVNSSPNNSFLKRVKQFEKKKQENIEKIKQSALIQSGITFSPQLNSSSGVNSSKYKSLAGCSLSNNNNSSVQSANISIPNPYQTPLSKGNNFQNQLGLVQQEIQCGNKNYQTTMNPNSVNSQSIVNHLDQSSGTAKNPHLAGYKSRPQSLIQSELNDINNYKLQTNVVEPSIQKKLSFYQNQSSSQQQQDELKTQSKLDQFIKTADRIKEKTEKKITFQNPVTQQRGFQNSVGNNDMHNDFNRQKEVIFSLENQLVKNLNPQEQRVYQELNLNFNQ